MSDWASEVLPPPSCAFRGAKIGERDCVGCKGNMRLHLFACPFHAGGVTLPECHDCHVPGIQIPQVSPSAPLVFIVQFPGYRERNTTFFLQPFAEAGWRVHVHVADPSLPALGVPAVAAKVGIPDAVIQWEEHSVARCNAPWREVIRWAYIQGAVPLSIDFGYFGHYEHFALDRYMRDLTTTSEISGQWAGLSDAPVNWDAQLPSVQDRRRRVLRGYAEARTLPRLIEEPYVALWLQQYPSLCRLNPCGHHNGLVARIAQELGAKGLKLAVKTAPSTPDYEKLTEWPEGVRIFRHEEVPGDTNQRLAVHAEYCLVISSSITNEFLLNDLPVVALGRSWFNGLGVFDEPPSWDKLPTVAPEVNNAARNKYARWWLERQFPSVAAGPALNAIIERAHAAPDRRGGSAITCVYAPDKAVEQIAGASVAATSAALPDWKRIVAVDAASPSFILKLITDKADVVASDQGQPPRMGALFAAAVRQAQGEYIFSIEHDVLLDQENARRAVEIMDRLPNRVAGLYIQSVDSVGRPNYPWANDWPAAQPFDAEGHFRVPKWPTLSCTLWRRAALALIDWARVPALEFVDGAIGDQLRRAGYLCLMTDLARAIHRPHSGRKALTGIARTLSIGCDRSIWERRGIRFGWNGAQNLDVHGPVPAALPFDTGSFREIYVGGGLESLDAAACVLFVAEAWRALRHGGRFDVMTRCADLLPLIRVRGFRIERDTPARIIAWAQKEQTE